MRRRPVLLAAAAAAVVVAGAGWLVWRGGLPGWLMPGPPPIAYLCQGAPDCRVTLLARLPEAPFPFVPDLSAGEPAPRGDHADDRVLIHVPPGFDPAKPFRILLFFHGHRGTLSEDVVRDMAIPAQVNASGRNVILVAPQLAVDAADSHPGKLMRSGAARRLVAAAVARAAAELGVPAVMLAGGPVIVAAFSGGWWPAAETLAVGGLGTRVRALVLLDAFYGRAGVFAGWAETSKDTGAMVALYTESSARNAETFLELIKEKGIEASTTVPATLAPGTLAVVKVDTPHLEVPAKGPPAMPVAEILRRLPPFDDAVPDPARLPEKP